MKPQPSIAHLVCYMEKFPWYFDYFIHSCSYNPTIDFYILADDTSYNKSLPSNVKIIYKSLQEISQIATQKLGIQVDIKFPYKICDIRPAFGVMFSKLLKDYDFWGFGDIDVVFGNIRNFMEANVLDNHDVISVRPDFVPGCFTLFRNSEKVNMLFTHSKDYQKVFCSDEHYCFDETNFAHDEFTEGKTYKEVNTEIESMMHVYRRLEEAHYIRLYADLHIVEGLPGRLLWKEGVLIYGGKFEIMMYHLIKLKRIFKPLKPLTFAKKQFRISPTKIY